MLGTMLHRWAIEEREYRRQEERRGRRHAFGSLDPASTALVVVDVVPFFVEENPYCAGIVPAINRLAGEVRSRGGTVAWVLPGHTPPSPVTVERLGAEVAGLYARSGGDGPLPGRLWSGLDAVDDDVIVEKFAASAFFPGRCDLHAILADRGIETVLVTGTVANVCVEATIRDASTLGYRVIAVADAIAARRDADLNATLYTVYRTFGDVRPVDEVVALLATGSGAPSAPAGGLPSSTMVRKLATENRVDREGLLGFVRPRHHWVLTTLRADGRPQSSPVSGGVTDDGRLVVSTYPSRDKVHNLRRDPRVSVCVLSDHFGGAWVQVDGTATVTDVPEAVEGMVGYYRSISGEHPDWDEYRDAMIRQGKCLISIEVERWSPIATGGFPASVLTLEELAEQD